MVQSSASYELVRPILPVIETKNCMKAKKQTQIDIGQSRELMFEKTTSAPVAAPVDGDDQGAVTTSTAVTTIATPGVATSTTVTEASSTEIVGTSTPATTSTTTQMTTTVVQTAPPPPITTLPAPAGPAPTPVDTHVPPSVTVPPASGPAQPLPSPTVPSPTVPQTSLPSGARAPAGPPKKPTTHPTSSSCQIYDEFPARFTCNMTHSIESHPFVWALTLVTIILICYHRFCRRRNVDDGGEYRAIAASMTDDAFHDDYSFGENDEYMSDDEEYGNGGTIQLSSLGKDHGLSLDELNG